MEQLWARASHAVRDLGEAAEGGLALLAQLVEEVREPEETAPAELRNAPKRVENVERDVQKAVKSEVAEVPPDLFDSLIIRPQAHEQHQQQLCEGDKVHVWSKSKQTWIEDGEVQEVSKFDVQILGDLVTKGSVYVLFDEGNKSKWIRPADLDKLLRRPGEATALGPSPMPPGDASPSARGPDDRLQQLQELQRRSKAFVDDSFPSKPRGRVTRWCRPHEIGAHDGRVLWRREDWQLLRGQPRADDVQQGELGDCWFLSSLAAMAEFQGGRLVLRLLPEQKKLSPAGVYLVRLWLGGSWRDILVDDRLPCIGNGTSTYFQLAYCATRRCQLWASIIEKGFAKACGSYEAIIGGEAEEALTVLTGWPCESIHFEREDFDSEILWATICTSRDAKFLMTVSTSSGKARSEEDLRAAGLVPNHAYSLIEVFDLLDESGARLRLLKIRNPHAKDKWRGNWSDSSRLWTAELRQRLGCAKAIEDGMFFMAYGDFLTWFERCTICKVQSDGWHKVRMPTPLPGQSVVPSTGSMARRPTLRDVWVALEMSLLYFQGWRLKVTDMTECCLTIAQPQDRARQGPLFRDLGLASIASAGFVLVSLEGEKLVASTVGHPRSRAVVSADCWLKPGVTYFLLPLSIMDEDVPAVFSCFSRKTVQISEHSFSEAAVLASWAAFIRATGKADSFHGAKVYVAKSHGGMVACLAENHSRGYFHVELGFQQLEGCQLSFSRGGSTTKDCLAPGEAQILQVMVPSGSGAWRSQQRYELRFLRPQQSAHSPDLVFASQLHRPFQVTAVSNGAKSGAKKWLPW